MDRAIASLLPGVVETLHRAYSKDPQFRIAFPVGVASWSTARTPTSRWFSGLCLMNARRRTHLRLLTAPPFCESPTVAAFPRTSSPGVTPTLPRCEGRISEICDSRTTPPTDPPPLRPLPSRGGWRALAAASSHAVALPPRGDPERGGPARAQSPWIGARAHRGRCCEARGEG